MGEYVCRVCDNKHARPEIDRLLAEKMSYTGISTTMRARGFDFSPIMIGEHEKKGHAVSTVAEPVRGRDLAVLVRDKTVAAVENGVLDIGDPNWRNVMPGLKAQDTIDRRDSRTDMRKAMIAFANMLSGGNLPVPENMLLDDGDTIEGTFEEVDSEPDSLPV